MCNCKDCKGDCECNKDKIEDEYITIVNPKQAKKYMKIEGLHCECYWNKDKFVYKFKTSETKKAWDLWRKYKL